MPGLVYKKIQFRFDGDFRERVAEMSNVDCPICDNQGPINVPGRETGSPPRLLLLMSTLMTGKYVGM